MNARRVQSEELLDDDMVVNKHNAILFIRPIAVEVPTWRDRLLMESSEEGLFDIIWDGHVILDGIEAAEDNVEEAYLS
jgi:hypothetical protein